MFVCYLIFAFEIIYGFDVYSGKKAKPFVCFFVEGLRLFFLVSPSSISC